MFCKCTYFVFDDLLQWKSHQMLCSHWQDSKTCFTRVCDSSDLLLDSILDCSWGIRNGVSFQGKVSFFFCTRFHSKSLIYLVLEHYYLFLKNYIYRVNCHLVRHLATVLSFYLLTNEESLNLSARTCDRQLKCWSMSGRLCVLQLIIKKRLVHIHSEWWTALSSLYSQRGILWIHKKKRLLWLNWLWTHWYDFKLIVWNVMAYWL